MSVVMLTIFKDVYSRLYQRKERMTSVAVQRDYDVLLPA